MGRDMEIFHPPDADPPLTGPGHLICGTSFSSLALARWRQSSCDKQKGALVHRNITPEARESTREASSSSATNFLGSDARLSKEHSLQACLGTRCCARSAGPVEGRWKNVKPVEPRTLRVETGIILGAVNRQKRPFRNKHGTLFSAPPCGVPEWHPSRSNRVHGHL